MRAVEQKFSSLLINLKVLVDARECKQLMADGDIYELTHNSIYGGQDVDNVYYYVQDGSFPVLASEVQIAAGLAVRFYAIVASALRNCISGDVVFQSIYVRNLFNSTGFHTEFVSDVGNSQAAGLESLPPHDAVNITFNTVNQQIGPGSKRISGIGEQFQVDGVINNAAYLVALAAYAGAVNDSLLVTLQSVGVSFRPVVVKRINISDAGVIKYRLPEDQDEAQYAQIDLFSVNPIITTQRSRRFSRV